jgi:MFS family permease
MACMIAQAWTTYILTVHGVLHLTDKGFTQMQAASVISSLVLLSGFARFPMGIIGDIIEPRILMTISMLCMGIALIFFWQSPDSLLLLLIVAGIYGFCFGATVTLFPTLLGNYFGPSAFAPLNGFMVPIVIPISAPVPFLAGIIHDRLHSYDWAFIPIIIMVFIATACSFMMTPPKKKNV